MNLCLLIAFAFLACAFAATATINVGLGGSMFSPQNSTINVGDSVQFVWSAGSHTVTTAALCPAAGTTTSLGVGPFDFPFSGPSATQTVGPFTSAGVYNFYCKIHCSIGMTGTITVSAPATSTPAPPPPPPPPPSAAAGFMVSALVVVLVALAMLV